MLQRIRKENTNVYHYNSLTTGELWVLKEALTEFITSKSYTDKDVELAISMRIEVKEMFNS